MPRAAHKDPRPASAVSTGVGAAGLVGLVLWTIFAWNEAMDGPFAAMIAVLACGVPMLAWSLLVDRVYLNPTTGIDWKRPLPPLSETRGISFTKIVGLWSTWGLIAFLYFIARWYWAGNYLFAMRALMAAMPVILILSIPYVLWLDRRLVEPKDGAWAFGHWLTGGDLDRDRIAEHLRAWAVKGFFLAFMISVVPIGWAQVIAPGWDAFESGPVRLIQWLVTTMFLADVAFATVGYVLTMRPLDAHIRSANPYAAGWLAALICYPPFTLMTDNGPLDYHPGSHDWTVWLWSWPTLQVVLGAGLVFLTFWYAWATVAFGLRFSNLTHRGILTHGPYRWTRHPAYLAKNLFWWASGLPFFCSDGWVEGVRNTAIMALVSGVYYWRAKTEERHLMADPAYRAYAEWMDRNDLWAKLRGLARRRRLAPRLQPAE
jgi:protein-S-isoprenylcysteine O-methyltransferase Ste14